jgi:Rrf2 family iron-sulfur cluster assembly transcriptional regulator
MLSNTTRYALRALIYLAINNEDGKKKIGIKRIAKDINIPSPFLGKILQTLAKQKILDSTKGPNGGFSISKQMQKITLYEVIKIIDGNDLFDKCLISKKLCNEHEEPFCLLHYHYQAIRTNIINMFSKHSIADLAMEFRVSANKIEL